MRLARAKGAQTLVRLASAILACAAPWAKAAPAPQPSPAPSLGYLVHLASEVRARLAAAAEAQAHAARPMPPVPIAVKWKPQKLGSLDLGSPVVAVTAADLDGDGRAEIYLVTAREVIAVGVAGRVHKLGRVAFTGDPAVPASRDVVGTAVVDGNAVVASVSSWARDLRIEWNGRTLSAKHGPGGFQVCGDRLALAAGRNHFRDGAQALLDARCRSDLTDASGAPLRIRGELAITGTLEVGIERCAARNAECRPAGTHQIKDVGVAFEIADVDRDGTPEVIASSASAPGDADAIRVLPLTSPPSKPVFKKSFNGGVAGIAVVDGDGDGAPEVLAVVRLAGATRIDVWRLD